MTIPSQKKQVEEMKYKIKQILWEKDFVRKLKYDITDHLVTPVNRDEYLGYDGKPLEPKYLTALTKMLSAMLLNFFMDKVIDAVIEAHEELQSLNPPPGEIDGLHKMGM